jgi:hypothetical protein
VRNKLIEIRNHILEFFLFLSATLFFWAFVDLCRYFIIHKGPAEVHFLWVGAVFTSLWISAGVVRDYIAPAYRSIRSLEIAQPAIDQQLEEQPEA